MKSILWFVSLVFIVAVSTGMILHPNALAGTYKWTDAQGNLHFTDDISRVPQSERETVEIISLPEPTSTYDSPAPPDDSLDTAAAGPESPGSPPEMDTADVTAAPLGPDTSCLENIEEEREQLEAQLAEDQERLAWVVKKRRYCTVRKNRALQKERASLEARIAETQKKLYEELPQRKMACMR